MSGVCFAFQKPSTPIISSVLNKQSLRLEQKGHRGGVLCFPFAGGHSEAAKTDPRSHVLILCVNVPSAESAQQTGLLGKKKVADK